VSRRGRQQPARQTRLVARSTLIGAALVTGALVLLRAPVSTPGRQGWLWLLLAGVLLVGWGGGVTVPGRAVLARRAVVVAVALVACGWALRGAPAGMPVRRWWPWLLLAGAGLLLVVWGSWRTGRAGSAGRVKAWSRRSRRNDGVASWWAIARTSSAFAVRRKAAVLRPSTAGLGRVARLRVPTTQYATAVARVGLWRVWSPIEDVTLRLGGPRTGKTGELAGRILDAPGAVIATSTRTDLVEVTGPVRAKVGPLQVFNPSGIGGLASTVTFDPIAGCAVPTTANYRAADLLSGVASPGAGGDREFWTAQAQRALAALLHAAALGGASMRDVLAWVADPDAGGQEIQRYLRRSSEPAYVSDAFQFLTTNDRTRSSICATIMPALGWLTDPTAAAAATTPDTPDGAGVGGVAGFDVPALLAQRGTVYMLGAEDAQVGPLVTALTGHIAREARRLAALQRGGRLDPPLTLALDEAALICPIPLDNWTADMGGRGVTIHIAAQSRAQLRQRWGDTGAAAILNNAATVLIYGGTRDEDDLTAYSMLTGHRDERVATLDERGYLTATTSRQVPVLSQAQIAQLPARRVVIIRRGMPPAVGTVAMAWRRRDVRGCARAAARSTSRAARAERYVACRRWLAAKTRPLLPQAAEGTAPAAASTAPVAGSPADLTHISTPRAESAVSVPVAVHSAAESNDHG
jgi:type IV secretory pathway TraG/TraD family ATPase VirD4